MQAHITKCLSISDTSAGFEKQLVCLSQWVCHVWVYSERNHLDKRPSHPGVVGVGGGVVLKTIRTTNSSSGLSRISVISEKVPPLEVVRGHCNTPHTPKLLERILKGSSGENEHRRHLFTLISF